MAASETADPCRSNVPLSAPPLYTQETAILQRRQRKGSKATINGSIIGTKNGSKPVWPHWSTTKTRPGSTMP
eukprot:138918-Rhodomonas_salina.1